MSTLVFDYEKLHDAVVLLLDPKHGPVREQLCRERIREIDHRRPARFYRAQEPLNELMHVAEQNKNKVLMLLDMVASRRDKTAEAVKAAAPTVTTARANWAKRMSGDPKAGLELRYTLRSCCTTKPTTASRNRLVAKRFRQMGRRAKSLYFQGWSASFCLAG